MQAFFEDHETNELIYCHVTLIRYEEKRVCESVTHPSRLAIQSLVLFCATMETHKWLRSSCRRQTPLFLRASHVSIIDIPFSNPAHNLSITSLHHLAWSRALCSNIKALFICICVLFRFNIFQTLQARRMFKLSWSRFHPRIILFLTGWKYQR